MSNGLADTSFSTGIDEKLAAVDVYSVSSDATLGGESEGIGKLVLEGMIGGNLEDAGSLLSSFSALKGLVVNADSLKNSLLSMYPGAQSALSSVSGGMSQSLLAGSGLNQIQATVGGLTNLINRADLSSVVGLSNLIAQVSGANLPVEIKDLTGMAVLGTNVLKQAASLGVPNAYSQFATGMSGNLPLLTQITNGILPTVAATSNVQMLTQIAAGPVASMVKPMNPGFVASFAASFALPANSTTSQVLKIASQVSGALAIIDPTWNKTPIPTTRAPLGYPTLSVYNNANPVLNASRDFVRMSNIASRSAVIPVAVQPTVIRRQDASTLPNPGSEFPVGTTSSAQTNPNGSSTTTYTQPNGVVVRRTTTPNSSLVTSEISYPPQCCPAPQRSATSGAYDAQQLSLPYTPSATPTSALVGSEEISPPASVFGLSAYPVGSYGSTGLQPDGSYISAIKAPDGSSYVYETMADGTIEETTLRNVGNPGFEISSDPFATTSEIIAEDPWHQATIIDDVYQQAQDEEYYYATSSSVMMSASESLRYEFPQTDLQDTADVDW